MVAVVWRCVAMAASTLPLAHPAPQAAPSVGSAIAEREVRRTAARYDDTFRKYTKRYFGVGFDWRLFKAQGLAESNLDSAALSWAGARGIMQLMPRTFREIASRNPEMLHIDDPEWNIAAGIYYDRLLWRLWERDSVDRHRREFMLASYNAGRATILRAQALARQDALDHRTWPAIERVAPKVDRWRYSETLGYVRRIDSLHAALMRRR
ncbi:MAG: transglycosylase SLT domain-containing protein [Gemmatimonadaceae bacterium]|nr:transglycosylase SLT domain-containing protein [Gemmatimonadaceae bacterium]